MPGSQDQHGQSACGPSTAVLAAFCDPRLSLVTVSPVTRLLPRMLKPSWGTIHNRSGAR